MATRTKYEKYVPDSERVDFGAMDGPKLIPRVKISFNAHKRIRKDINSAAKKEGVSANEWLCNAVIDALQNSK